MAAVATKNVKIWQPFCAYTMATAAILNFFNPPKAATYNSGYSYKVDFCILVAILDLKWPP
jgi:hypothetical protein